MTRYTHTPAEKKKHSKGLCKTPYCTRQHRPGKWDCTLCNKNIQKRNNPLKYVYRNLRTNAKRRGKEFTLTLQEFIDFVGKTNYMRKRGRGPKKFQIDRIDETKGYHAWNIQSITLRENVLKYNKFKQSLKEEAGF